MIDPRRIDVGYDQPSSRGGYRSYIDDISLTSSLRDRLTYATLFSRAWSE